jgi:DNA topoisomerase-1
MSVSIDSVSQQLTALAADVTSLKSQLALVLEKLGVEVPKAGKGKRGAKAAKATGATDAPKAPRPANPYMNFSNAKRAEVKAANPTAKLGDLSKLIGAQWKALTVEQQAAYKNPVA